MTRTGSERRSAREGRMPHHSKRPVRLYETLMRDIREPDPTARDTRPSAHGDTYDQLAALPTSTLLAMCRRKGLNVDLRSKVDARESLIRALVDERSHAEDRPLSSLSLGELVDICESEGCPVPSLLGRGAKGRVIEAIRKGRRKR